jgi:hypothetical protein
MDAATPQICAWLRNDAFDRLTANVRRLVRAKGGPGRLPLVYLVFMPTRANVQKELLRFDELVRVSGRVAELCRRHGIPLSDHMEGFQEAWNSPLMQELRSELRDGRFHRYCFDSPDCPLVRKAEESGRLSASQQMLLHARRLLARGRRSGFGWPGHAWRRSKALVRSVHARWA